MEELLTVHETAKQTKMAEVSIRRMITREQIGVVRLGRAVRIRAEDVRRLIQKNYRPVRNAK